MYNIIKKLVCQKRNLFITGGGGVGKSYYLNKLKEDFPEMVMTATTGISSININGETIHKWSGAKIFNNPIYKQVAIIKNNKEVYDSIKECKILAIDEISMLASYQLDYLDKLFKKLRGINEPFGGIQLILVGDLFQLPPVKKGEYVTINSEDYLIDYCFKAKCWKSLNFEIINLTKCYRQKDKEFVKVLNSIRKGKPQNLELLEKRTGIDIPINAVRLFAINRKVDDWNKKCYDKLDTEEVIYWASDKFYKGKKSVNPWDKDSKLTDNQKRVMEDFNKKCKAVRILKLKVGARVMLLQNLDTSQGLCNGTCGYVTKLETHSVSVKFDNDLEIELKRKPFQLHSNGKVLIERKQIPLMLAYACSIHKAQSASIDNLAIDFDQIFENGQTYVALSRATNLEHLYLQNFNENTIKVDNEIVKFYEDLK